MKWLSQIHVQEDQYLGKFQARWYRTLKGEMIDGEMKWVETAITKLHLKSFVARVTKSGDTYKVQTLVLNDGTPIKSVEVKVDEGSWQPATADPSTTAKYGWKLYNYSWKGAPAGEHTLVSRVTDVNGQVQPTEEELQVKKTFLQVVSRFTSRSWVLKSGRRSKLVASCRASSMSSLSRVSPMRPSSVCVTVVRRVRLSVLDARRHNRRGDRSIHPGRRFLFQLHRVGERGAEAALHLFPHGLGEDAVEREGHQHLPVADQWSDAEAALGLSIGRRRQDEA